jgi:protein O-GlcNAc transferase
LWIYKPAVEVQNRLIDKFKENGIDEHRIVFAEKGVGRNIHLARYKFADLILDTFPYGASTTCSDALNAGVPVITCPEDRLASRNASLLLNECGLNEWVVNSHEDYVDKAIKFSTLSRVEIDDYKIKVHDLYKNSRLIKGNELPILFEKMLIQLATRYDNGKQIENLIMDSNGILNEIK